MARFGSMHHSGPMHTNDDKALAGEIGHLARACQLGDRTAVSGLLNRGVPVNAVSRQAYVGAPFLPQELWREEIARLSEGGLTPLMWAAFCGHHAVVSTLISNAAVLNLRDEVTGVPWGRTALMYGALHGEAECLRLLLSAGADQSLRDEGVPYSGAGCTALHHAVRAARKEAVSVLSGTRAVVDLQNDAGETALF